MIDLLYIGGFLAIVWFIGWFAYRVGEDKAARVYQSELASTRAKLRRVQRDLDLAYEETAMVRRAAKGEQP